MTIIKRIAITIASIAISGAAGATALASQSTTPGNARPGWGLGDKSHVHTGPPGQSVNVSASNTVNVSNSNSQGSSSGGASVTGGSRTGNISTGSASNSNSTTTSVSLSNF
jgi:hypothetical protein